MRKRLTLHLTATHLVSSEVDLDSDAPSKTLAIDAGTFDKSLALAKEQGWQEPGRNLKCRFLSVPSVAALTRCLQQALASKPVEPTRATRFSTGGQLATYFAQPAHQRVLVRLVDFLAQGGELKADD